MSIYFAVHLLHLYINEQLSPTADQLRDLSYQSDDEHRRFDFVRDTLKFHIQHTPVPVVTASQCKHTDLAHITTPDASLSNLSIAIKVENDVDPSTSCKIENVMSPLHDVKFDTLKTDAFTLQ